MPYKGVWINININKIMYLYLKKDAFNISKEDFGYHLFWIIIKCY